MSPKTRSRRAADVIEDVLYRIGLVTSMEEDTFAEYETETTTGAVERSVDDEDDGETFDETYDGTFDGTFDGTATTRGDDGDTFDGTYEGTATTRGDDGDTFDGTYEGTTVDADDDDDDNDDGTMESNNNVNGNDPSRTAKADPDLAANAGVETRKKGKKQGRGAGEASRRTDSEDLLSSSYSSSYSSNADGEGSFFDETMEPGDVELKRFPSSSFIDAARGCISPASAVMALSTTESYQEMLMLEREDRDVMEEEDMSQSTDVVDDPPAVVRRPIRKAKSFKNGLMPVRKLFARVTIRGGAGGGATSPVPADGASGTSIASATASDAMALTKKESVERSVSQFERESLMPVLEDKSDVVSDTDSNEGYDEVPHLSDGSPPSMGDSHNGHSQEGESSMTTERISNSEGASSRAQISELLNVVYGNSLSINKEEQRMSAVLKEYGGEEAQLLKLLEHKRSLGFTTMGNSSSPPQANLTTMESSVSVNDENKEEFGGGTTVAGVASKAYYDAGRDDGDRGVNYDAGEKDEVRKGTKCKRIKDKAVLGLVRLSSWRKKKTEKRKKLMGCMGGGGAMMMLSEEEEEGKMMSKTTDIISHKDIQEAGEVEVNKEQQQYVRNLGGTGNSEKDRGGAYTKEKFAGGHLDNAVHADFRMISGCMDSQTSSDVQDISSFELPDPAGKAGGACTSALLKVLYAKDLSFAEVLEETRAVLRAEGYDQIPQLTASRAMDVRSPFRLVQRPIQGSDSLRKKGKDGKYQNRSRALLVGINYVGQKGELRGCHDDVLNMRKYIMDVHGFQYEDVTVLIDDGGQREAPTRLAILREFSRLAAISQDGDSVFFHYSGECSVLLISLFCLFLISLRNSAEINNDVMQL